MFSHFVRLHVVFVFDVVCLDFFDTLCFSFFRIVPEDGLLVATSVGNVVYRHHGIGQSSHAHHNHRGLAQIAVAHHTSLRYHSHRVDLNARHTAMSPAFLGELRQNHDESSYTNGRRREVDPTAFRRPHLGLFSMRTAVPFGNSCPTEQQCPIDDEHGPSTRSWLSRYARF